MRVIDFSDGFTSSTSPTEIGVSAQGFLTYANDAAYESANGAGEAGDVYYNTTDDVLKYYDANASSWVEIPQDSDLVKTTGNQTIAGDKTFTGNTTLSGTTTIVNSTNLDVTDANITVNDGGNDASSEGAGITVERTGTDGKLIYADASATKFKAGASGSEVDLVGTSSTQTLSNKSYSDAITLDEISTPSTPSTGKWKLYPKTDGIYQLDDAGVETNLSSGGGGVDLKYAYVSDHKTSGTQGGTFSSGAYRTRDLNTLEGDTSFISVSSNQITLDAGTYTVTGWATGYRVAKHKARFQNITDASTTIVGSSVYTDAPDAVSNVSTIEGEFTIASSKTFELQHRCSTTNTNSGFGQNSGFGEDEIYSKLIIIKKG